MKKIMNIFESKRSLLGLLALGGVIFTTVNIQENSRKLKQVTNLESGIQTCFTRVNQSYTANILGDTASTYLTQNFQNLTEECFAEGILSVENKLHSDLSNVAKLLSTMASNVHWFHEDILAPGNSLAKSGEGRDVGNRFEKIETTKDQVLELTDKYKAQIHSSLNQDKTIFSVLATLLAVLMIGEYMNITRRRLSNSAREKEALLELMGTNGGATSVKVGEIIKMALEQNSLVHCARLFANFHHSVGIERSRSKMSLETLITPAPLAGKIIHPEISNEAIEKIWQNDSITLSADTKGTKALEDINLEQMSSAVVDLLAEKLFSQGVQMDINIPESLMIKSNQEDLEQTLFHLLTFAINSSQGENGEKHISVQAHKLGDVVAFDLVYSGTGFDDAILKQRAGLAPIQDNTLELDLQIAQTLLHEMDAKVQLDNKIDQHGNVNGGRVKIIFKSGSALALNAGSKLVNLKVGSKKEILAALAGA